MPLEKIALVLVHAMRKLPYYFQAHTVWVLTKYPLQSLLRNLDFIGRIAKWRTRLGRIDTNTRGSVGVCQFLVRRNECLWMMCLMQEDLESGLEKSLRLRFLATNNEAEYEALIAGLRAPRS